MRYNLQRRVPDAKADRHRMIIAIDGPAGSGKSSVAKLLASRIGFHLLDTGAMYRAVAYRALSQGVSLADTAAIARIATSDPIAFSRADGDTLPTRVSIAGEDVTAAIRSVQVDEAVSPVAKVPEVRSAMVAQQRALAAAGDIVVEGRDIGTVVFPDAALKIYLTASAEERAKRRVHDSARGGTPAEQDAVHAALLRRDEIDSSRKHSPLAIAGDAIVLDTTGMTLEQVVDRIEELVCQRR